MAETDIKTINGIGPAMEKKLADLGIADIPALAARTDAKDIAELLATRGVDEARVSKWIAAAQDPVQEPSAEAPKEAALAETEAAAIPRELTFHELNMQARKIDREHARLRLNATAAANVAAEAELKGIARLNRPRRVQKNIRPLVR